LRVFHLRSLLWIGVSVLTLACQRGGHTIHRPWSAAADLELVSYENTTMLARRVARASGSLSLPLGAIEAGDVLFYASFDAPPGRSVAIDLEPAGTTCVVNSELRRWQPCRLPISRATADARLHVRSASPAGGDVVISSPLVRSATESKRPTVIVVLADTLRFDRLASYAPRAPVGARLDALAGDGVVFERAHSSSSWTRTAVATLLTGLDVGAHRVVGRSDALAPALDGLPQALQRAGYRTLAWSTNANVLPVWGFAQGFDAFHDLGALEWPKEKAHASTVFSAVQAALEDPHLAPVFLYVHLMDPHYPYRPQPADLDAVASDERLAGTFPGSEPDAKAEGEYLEYLAEIRGMDRALGAFFDELRERGLYDDALIAFVADHGEEFLDHGGTRHGKTLYDEVLRVPMILKLPANALAGSRIRGHVGLIDVAPTLLGVLGLDDALAADGRNLWDAEERVFRDESAAQVALLDLDRRHQTALIAGWRKLIVDHDGSEQLFDLEADPRETENLVGRNGDEAEALQSLLEARLSRREAGWHVRACGGRLAFSLRLDIAARGEARGAQFEQEDRLRLLKRLGEDARYRAELRLSPRKVPQQLAGRVVETLFHDEDEIVVSSADGGTITITSVAGSALRYTVGTSDEVLESPQIAVTASDPGVILSNPTTACRAPAGAGERTLPASHTGAYVRIWFSPPPARSPEPDVDPALRERLRALGYSW
jgi:arylsulfatase A-like enzyme